MAAAYFMQRSVRTPDPKCEAFFERSGCCNDSDHRSDSECICGRCSTVLAGWDERAFVQTRRYRIAEKNSGRASVNTELIYPECFLGVLTSVSYLLGVLRQQSTVILIELPCFVLCVMIKADQAEGLSALLDDDW